MLYDIKKLQKKPTPTLKVPDALLNRGSKPGDRKHFDFGFLSIFEKDVLQIIWDLDLLAEILQK